MIENESAAASGLSEDSWSTVDDTRLLFVSAEPPESDLTEMLESEGVAIEWKEEFEAALDRIDAEPPDILLADRERIPEGTGDLGTEVSVPVTLLWVEDQTPEAYRRTLQLGFDTFVRRDIGPESLLRLIEQELRI